MTRPSPTSLVAEALGCDPSTLSADSALGAHPKWDSLGHVSIIVALEAHYGVLVNDDTIRQYETMKGIMRLFQHLEGDLERFDSRWETDIYANGRMLNRYPSEVVVSFVHTAFGRNGGFGRRALDLGCGAGNNVIFLAREGFDVVGVDGSQTAIHVAGQRLTEAGLGAELRRMEFGALNLDDRSFDCVIDRCALTHNSRSVIERTLDEVRRVLKPDGIFFSQMFSARMADREFGRPLGDGSYDDFSAGYFADIGRTFFATPGDIKTFYGSRFEELSVIHATYEDGTGRAVDALWDTSWQRR